MHFKIKMTALFYIITNSQVYSWRNSFLYGWSVFELL